MNIEAPSSEALAMASAPPNTSAPVTLPSESLTELRFPLTPASDKVFGTVEMAEAILSELPLKDLISSMRTCSTLHQVVKTSKAVMRGRVWLSVKSSLETAEESNEENNSEEWNILDEFGEVNDMESIYHPVFPTLPFRKYLDFIMPATKQHNLRVLGMIDTDMGDPIFGGGGSPKGAGLTRDDKVVVVFDYNSDATASEDSTHIEIDATSSSELWRRLPLTDAEDAMKVVIRVDGGEPDHGAGDFDEDEEKVGRDPANAKMFDRTKTLGDMYLWLSKRMAELEEIDFPRHLLAPSLSDVVTLTESRFPNTPASDQVFATVELAEAILNELTLKDLHVAMRACKSFCNIAKTSKAVVRDKVWLRWSPKEDEEEDNEDQVRPTSSFRQYLTFQIPKTNNKDSFAIEMIDGDPAAGGAGSKDDKAVVVYLYSTLPNRDRDTILAINLASSNELWRRLPLTDASGGADVYLASDMPWDERDDRSKTHFPKTSTLGEMYSWLIAEVIIHGGPPYSRKYT